MNKPPSFPFYVKDFLSSETIIMMTNAEIGAYVLLLAYCWDWQGLPENPQVLKRLARIDSTFPNNGDNIFKKFEIIDGKLWNKKLYDIHLASIAFRKNQSDKGKKGGRPKKKATAKPWLNNGLTTVKPEKSFAFAFAPAFAFSSAPADLNDKKLNTFCPDLSQNEQGQGQNDHEIKPKKKSATANKIDFDRTKNRFINISDNDMTLWSEAYPACDIELELKQMSVWILSAGSKGHKSNWRKFITNWLQRSQDKGGTRNYSNSQFNNTDQDDELPILRPEDDPVFMAMQKDDWKPDERKN